MVPLARPTTRRPRLTLSAFAAAALIGTAPPGCASDPAVVDGASTGQGSASDGSTTGDADGEADGQTGESTTRGESPSDTSTTGEVAPSLAPARGAAIVAVDANQGVAVPIGRDGTGVPGQARKNRLLGGRPMQIRAAVALDPSFEPRTLQAHLLLTALDGSVERRVATRALPGGEPVVDGVVEEGFTWLLEGTRVVPGMTYAIELYEHDVLAEENDAAPPYYPPVDGVPVPVGVEAVNQRIAVTLVPIRYDDGNGCVSEVEFSDAVLNYIEGIIYMQHPVTEVELTVREPMSIDVEIFQFERLVNLVGQQRSADRVSPEVYYFGWIQTCEGTALDDLPTGGMAPLPTEFTPETAYLRVAAAKWSQNLDWVGDTTVHELGHAQGRKHVSCSGGEADPDATYPVPGGGLDGTGFGVVDGITRDATSYFDVLSYCNPQWTSSHGWTQIEPVIRELSSWSTEDHQGGADTSAVLIGTLTSSGMTDWRTLPGAPPRASAEDAPHEIAFAYPGGRATEFAATVVDIADSDAKWIIAPLPHDFALATAITHRHRGRVARIEPAAVRQNHPWSAR